jgi:hypothetical protein
LKRDIITDFIQIPIEQLGEKNLQTLSKISGMYFPDNTLMKEAKIKAIKTMLTLIAGVQKGHLNDSTPIPYLNTYLASTREELVKEQSGHKVVETLIKETAAKNKITLISQKPTIERHTNRTLRLEIRIC